MAWRLRSRTETARIHFPGRWSAPSRFQRVGMVIILSLSSFHFMLSSPFASCSSNTSCNGARRDSRDGTTIILSYLILYECMYCLILHYHTILCSYFSLLIFSLISSSLLSS